MERKIDVEALLGTCFQMKNLQKLRFFEELMLTFKDLPSSFPSCVLT
jgi:hypothetical protein